MQNNTQTSEQSTPPSGEEKSMSSPAVSPASRSASPENASASRMNATYGLNSCVQLNLFDRDGSWARMFSELLIGRADWYSSRCALIWSVRVMRFNRSLYRLRVSAHRTDGIGSGLLPTVQTQGLKVCKQGKTMFMPTELLPTPTASCANSGTAQERKDGIRRSSQLHQLVAQKAGRCSQLNPLFIQEMMGFPYLWTELPFQNGERNP